MTLFFISSPGQMAHRALSVLEEKKPENLTIVTTDAIRPFLEGRVKAKIITLKTEPNLITRSSKSKIVSNAIRSKLEYRRLFKDIENEDVYLFFTSWGVVPISYVKKLSKRNKVYLYPESFLNDMYEEEKSFVATGMKLAVKLLLGLDVYIVRWNNIPVWELRPNSFPMEIVEYDGFNVKLPKQFMMDTDLLKGKRVLFLGSKFEIDCEESEDKVKLTDELMDIFEKNFKGEYVIKAHPIDKILYGKMKDSKFVIPSYVLAESLWDQKWDIVVGYHSEALVSAKMHTKAKVISLLNMYVFTNAKVRQYWIDTFGKEGILMPKDMEELNKMIRGK